MQRYYIETKFEGCRFIVGHICAHIADIKDEPTFLHFFIFSKSIVQKFLKISYYKKSPTPLLKSFLHLINKILRHTTEHRFNKSLRNSNEV